MRRIRLRHVGYLSTIAIAGAGASITWYRPIPYPDGADPVNKIDRSSFSFLSGTAISDVDDKDIPYLYHLGKVLTTKSLVLLCRLFMHNMGTFDVRKDSKYNKFIEYVINRPCHRPLITISNHRSLLDDPGMMSSMLPLKISLNPAFVRYSLCAQEFCFSSKVIMRRSTCIVSNFTMSAAADMPTWYVWGVQCASYLARRRRQSTALFGLRTVIIYVIRLPSQHTCIVLDWGG